MKKLYASTCYSDPLDIRASRIYCENTLITEVEQRMILELIRLKHPRKILEIGVHAGGTSVLILHCLHMLGLSSELYSVDRKRKNSRRLVRIKCLCQTIRV